MMFAPGGLCVTLLCSLLRPDTIKTLRVFILQQVTLTNQSFQWLNFVFSVAESLGRDESPAGNSGFSSYFSDFLSPCANTLH